MEIGTEQHIVFYNQNIQCSRWSSHSVKRQTLSQPVSGEHQSRLFLWNSTLEESIRAQRNPNASQSLSGVLIRKHKARQRMAMSLSAPMPNPSPYFRNLCPFEYLVLSSVSSTPSLAKPLRHKCASVFEPFQLTVDIQSSGSNESVDLAARAFETYNTITSFLQVASGGNQCGEENCDNDC